MERESEEIVVHGHSIRLVSSLASKITNVNLYSGRADITRLFEFDIKAGKNTVSIVGLPRSFQENNVKVDGLGHASIHNVVIGKTEPLPQQRSGTRYAPAMTPIIRSRKELKNSLESARQCRSSLNTYLGTVSLENTDIPTLEGILDGYTRLCEKLDSRILDLEERLEAINTEIQVRSAETVANDESTPSWKVTVDLNGKIDERVKLSVTYAVCSADWTPSYDVRVDTQETDHRIEITYKAIITQATGESWENVPLTLGTVTPSLGIRPPTLHPWMIDTYQRGIQSIGVPPMGVPMSATAPVIVQDRSRSRSRSPRYHRSRSFSASPERQYRAAPVMQQPTVVPVSNKGDIVATFNIPGLVTVPDNQGKHNVVVAELAMETVLMWYAIPAVDSMVHLKARIKNNSEYTFVPGLANIYLDGSFVATTRLPPVSPQETFNCPLGLDRSIPITYHPLEKKSAQSGYITKTTSRSFTQKITILNTKSTTVHNMKVIDRIPVSRDERIVVKLLNPALALSSSGEGRASVEGTAGGSTQKEKEKGGFRAPVFRPVPVSENVIALWDGSDGDHTSDESHGRDGSGMDDGKINWVLSILPHKSVSLSLQFDVVYPENLLVQGL